MFYFLASPIIVFAAQEVSTPPAPKQRASGAPPYGLPPAPIDDWIPGLLIGATLTGSYYFLKKRKKLS
ncbi:hypothetical protein [Zunongwangia sp.]|uniref:hypothetical protein n=1 Tax=Zunongwangia sp. TaxID=1965325 RepID=UPI003AA7B5E9